MLPPFTSRVKEDSLLVSVKGCSPRPSATMGRLHYDHSVIAHMKEPAMSLQPQEIPPVPEETRRVAQAAFPRGNSTCACVMNSGLSMTISSLPPSSRPVGSQPRRLGASRSTTVLQFAEGLSDRQAADAVRSRIDWKYALSLELTDPGFDHTVLSEFRTRLVAGQAEHLLLDTFLARCASAASSRRVAVNAPTRRTCWRPFGSSTGWNSSARPSATPSTVSPSSPQTGCGPRPRPLVRPLWPPHGELPFAPDRRGA